MLLGSPPDTVHGAALRGTGPSSLLIWGRRHNLRPGAGIHPCWSGLQIQGTANSPTSAALFCAEAKTKLFVIVLHFFGFINWEVRIFLICSAGRGFTLIRHGFAVPPYPLWPAAISP